MKANKLKENTLWILLAVSISLALLWQFVKLPDATDRLQKLPLKGAGYSSVDIPTTVQEESYFKEVNFIKRMYTIDNHKYFIYILDGTNNRHAVHDPTYCFRGSGWEIISKKTIPIQGGDASLYTLEKGNEKKEALLWFSDGEKKFNSPMEYWYKTTLRRLTLGYSGKEPLLFVIQPLDNQNTINEQNIKEIVSILDV